MSNFIYLPETEVLLNLDQVKTISANSFGGTYIEYYAPDNYIVGYKESFDYVKELVYEVQFKNEKE